MADNRKSRGLGRGLSALMADVAPTQPVADAATRYADRTIPIESLLPNPDQPRRSFASDQLDELAESIRNKGIIQPLIVRPHPTESGKYEIVAGERRWRASQIAQLHDIPVIIRELNDTEVLEVAIIENVQRADLNPVDEANSFAQLMDRFGHTQEQVASALGKSRSHIANMTRLLTLPSDVLGYLSDGKLTTGHARALIGNENAGDLARHIIQKKLSVRETEKLVKAPKATIRSKTVSKQAKDTDTVNLERELGAALGMKVTIDHTDGKQSGRLVLHYRDLAQLDDLMRVLGGS